MGIRTLTQAKEILLLAVGEEKAKAVFGKKENTWESISVRTDSGERPTRT